MILLDGKKVASEIESTIAQTIKDKNLRVKLGIISCGQDEASKVYINQKIKAAGRCGIQVERYLAGNPDDIKFAIFGMKNEGVDGIILQLPLPEEYRHQTQELLDYIPPELDVDGLSRASRVYGTFTPCTPLGIMRLLDAYDIDPAGKDVTIIGRSDLVGKPLAKLMLDRNATVTMCHSKTPQGLLDYHIATSNIIVSAAGVPHLVKPYHVGSDAVVIDVGINRVDGRLVGDVDFEPVSNKVAYITPVPGGIGPMTVAMLMENTLKAAMQKNN